jgi:hypothetical protein
MSTPTITTAESSPARAADAPAAVVSRRRGLPYRVISWAVPVLLLLVWELLARIAQQIASVRAAASQAGRPAPRFSVSLRPILGPTEELAWKGRTTSSAESARSPRSDSSVPRAHRPIPAPSDCSRRPRPGTATIAHCGRQP